MKREIVAFPDNLETKALVVRSRISITEVAAHLGKSREYLTKVLNGHERGAETLQMVKEFLKEKEQ